MRKTLLTFATFSLLAATTFAGPKKCKCDESAIENRQTKNESWNRNLNEGCAALMNKDFLDAFNSFESALKISEDAYVEGILKCLTEMKNSGQLVNSTSSSPTQSSAEPKASEASNSSPSKPDPVKETAVAVPPPTPVTSASTTKSEPAKADVETEADKKDVRTFTSDELSAFQVKGMQKVNTFQSYLNKIGNKSTSINDAMDAITNALKLFYGSTYVQVSSTNRDTRPKFLTKTYLERVRALNYDKVIIEWADCQYASNLKKAPDGNYYGYIKFRQRFKGIKDNKVLYEDITDKTIAVVLRAYDKAVEGEKVENFDIFLGDIEVVQTVKN